MNTWMVANDVRKMDGKIVNDMQKAWDALNDDGEKVHYCKVFNLFSFTVGRKCVREKSVLYF